MAEVDISAPQLETVGIADEVIIASAVSEGSTDHLGSADAGHTIEVPTVHDSVRASDVSEGELFVEEAVLSTRVPTFGEYDRDFRTKTLSTVGGFKSSSSSVQENILSHPVVLKNRTEPGVTSHISLESRQVMRKGFDLGIASPALRIMYDTRIKELEEELELERHARSKVEKQRGELQREVTLLTERVEEATDSTQVQLEMSKRREVDFQKLQRDLEDCQSQNESTLTTFRKKHQDSVNVLAEQIDQLHRIKQRQEKEKNQYKIEADELRGQIDQLTKSKASGEKLCKQYESQISDLNSKLSDMQRELLDINSHRNRYQSDNVELSHKLEELENQFNQLNKAKQIVTKELEEAKLSLEDETLARNKALSDNRSLQIVQDQLRLQLDDEQEKSAELQRQIIKINSESLSWRQKFESGEGCIRPEEVEDMKKKFIAKLQDSESQLEAVVGKAMGLEKAKNRLQMEVESLLADVEKAQSVNAQNEKRQRQFDKLVDEWKRKVADLQIELENAQKESRSNAADSYKIKAQLEETHETIEALRRENKNLSDEIHDLTDVIGQGNQKIMEVEKLSRRYETEKNELQATLEEAEQALEQEEAKVTRANMEVVAIKQEMERRLIEKDEEFETVRKNHQRTIESMQASIDAETRNKVDALRMKKKHEQDINDLEAALDASNKAKAEVERNFKKYQQQIRDLQQMIDDEQRAKRSIKEELTAAERRANLLAGELEEFKAQIDVLEKTRKTIEGDLYEAADRVSELTAANIALSSAKKKLETDIQAIHSDFEEHVGELKIMDDQAKKAMADASRLADELRQEQDHASQIDKLRRNLETQVKELQARVDEAEATALHGGKKLIQTLEQRIREVQSELEAEQHRHNETQKNQRKQERRTQELTLQVEEDRKAQDRMHDMIDKMQHKMKSYKKQVEEAEEIAAINLTKYRKIQHELEESDSRADVAENMVGHMKASNRSSVSRNENILISQPLSGITVKTVTTRSNVSSDRKLFDS